MQVLITGAAGRLGQILQAVWADRDQPGFRPLWSARHASNSTFLPWDILSGPAPDLPKGCVILHFAGQLRGTAPALAANAKMALLVCEAAKAASARHVFLASSAAVYGPSAADLFEVHAPDPRSDYGRAKLDMERAALCWAQTAGPDAPGVTCLRIGNVLGADALFGHARRGHDMVVDRIPGQDGGPLRSYIGPHAFAQKLAGLVGRINAKADMPNILNVTSPGAVFMADLLSAAEIGFRFGPSNLAVFPKVSLSTAKLAALVPLGAMQAFDMVQDWRQLAARLQ